ncbi:hypothetical protein D3C72_1528460 [compost metagenome]
MPITLFGPAPTVTSGIRNCTRALPLASAVRLFMSPAWCSGMVIWPCGLPDGLKWPPALIASGAEQSPFSWTWKPCEVPGGRPVTATTTITPAACWSNVTRPAVLVPLLDCNGAAALAPTVTRAAAGAAAGAALALAASLLVPEVPQPAIIATAVPTAKPQSTRFMPNPPLEMTAVAIVTPPRPGAWCAAEIRHTSPGRGRARGVSSRGVERWAGILPDWMSSYQI